jgi:hypothetical protein
LIPVRKRLALPWANGGEGVPVCGDDGVAEGIDPFRFRLQFYLRHGRPILLLLEFATHLACYGWVKIS